MLYVRKKPKGFGRDAQIEGYLPEGSRVLLVEDLATDGGTQLNFVDAIRHAGGEIAHTFVILHCVIFPERLAALAAKGVTLLALATWRAALSVAAAGGYPAPKQVQRVRHSLQ